MIKLKNLSDIEDAKSFIADLAKTYEKECESEERVCFNPDHFINFLTEHLSDADIDTDTDKEEMQEEAFRLEDVYMVQCAFFRNGCCQNNGSNTFVSTACEGNKLKCIYPGFREAAKRWATYGEKKR